VLGLGDSNYDNFNKMGRILNSKLEALGGKRFYRTVYADDATGLEDAVEPWRKGLLPALETTARSPNSDRARPSAS
jgi:sulfite reductase alpha subunit-like flavoprotein